MIVNQVAKRNLNLRRNIIKIIFLTLFPILNLQAQTIIVENIRLSDDTFGLQGIVNLNFYTSKNKSEFTKSAIGTKIQFRKGKSIFKSFNNYKLIYTNEEDIEDWAFQQFRYNYLINDLFVLDVFAQAQTNQILRIDFRGLIGAGPKIKILQKDKIKLESAALYMYEYENEKDTSIIHRDHRLSLNYFLSLKIGKILNMDQYLYYQPRLDLFDDYRISTGIQINFKLSKRFAFNMNAAITYDSEPVKDIDIPNLTYIIKNGISILF